MFKTKKEIIVIQGEATDPIETGVVFWSHDRGTAKLIFQLQKDCMNQPLSAGTIVPILLEFNSDTAEGGRGRHIYNATIEDSLESIVSIVLEDNILGYQGRVDGSVYIELPDSRSLDTAGRFTFDIKRSPIDENVPELEDYYWQGFNEIIDEYHQTIITIKSEAKALIDSLTADVTEVKNDIGIANSRVDEISKKIDDNDVLTKAESSANVIYQLIGKETVKIPIIFDFEGKIATSNVENPHKATAGFSSVLPVPSQITGEVSQNAYNALSALDGNVINPYTAANKDMTYLLIQWNVLEAFKRILGDTFFNDRGATTVSECMDVVRSIVKEFSYNVFGYGTGPSGNSLNTTIWNGGGAWSSGVFGNKTNTVSKISRKMTSKQEIEGFLNSDGNASIIAYSEKADGATKAAINVDYVSFDFTIEISANEHIKSMMAANHVENLATQEEAENGVSDLKTMTPKRTAEQTLARFGQSFTPSTKFIAHRGNNSFYPENSIAAFEKTSRHWGAETDIQLTTDGKWYCFHDRTLDRMTNGTGNFMDKTSSEIEALRLDTGNGINTLSDVEKKIPTFEQYLNACIKARIVPVIEITPLKTDFTDAQLDSIVTVIRRKGLLNKCVIICFTYEVLVKMRQRMPYTVMHWLISEYSEEMIQKCVINNFVPSFDYSKASVNQALIDKIHDTGLECGLWTVPYNDHQKYSDMGVDYITTDSASGNLRYFEPALRSGMQPNNVNLGGPTYMEETSNGEIHIRVNVTGGQNDVGVYICALESWAIPRHSLNLIGYVRATKISGFTFVPVSVGVGGYSANDSSIADANIKFGYLTTGTNWEQRATYAAFDIFYPI